MHKNERKKRAQQKEKWVIEMKTEKIRKKTKKKERKKERKKEWDVESENRIDKK